MATGLTRRRYEALGRAQGRAGDGSTRVEFLEFTLAGEAYAVEIAWITEILKPLPITHVPRAAPDILGVMSVRGRLVTVLDLRKRLHHPPSEEDARARILLVHGEDDEVVGLRVDEVVQVHRLADADIEPAAVLGGDQPAHIGGVGRSQGRVLVLIDIRPIVGTS
jgi:purine-binding chemotaxis protein CheW